jgi:hypothetical protein
MGRKIREFVSFLINSKFQNTTVMVTKAKFLKDDNHVLLTVSTTVGGATEPLLTNCKNHTPARSG